MFNRMDKATTPVRFTFNGIEFTAQQGDTIAAALLASEHLTTGLNPASGKDRGPFCMMGSCFECLVEVDGQSVQACQIVVTPGLEVTSLTPPATGLEEAV